MADKTTFIKLDRNIVNWRWFKAPRVLSVFIWLIIKANVKEGHFEKDTIKRGSLVTSNAHIAEECGLTQSNVRTVLTNLETTGEIGRIIRNHYQIITVNNYESYQADLSKMIPQLASNLEGNSQATRNNQRIKERKNKRIYPPKSPQGGTPPPGEGTEGEIPEMYRDQFKTYEEYLAWRNQ